jgi:outer membrane protein
MFQMKNLAIAALAVFGFVGSFSTTDASAQKIAVVNRLQVISEMPEAQSANQKLQVMQKAWTDSLQMMQTAIQAKLEGYQKIMDTMSPEAKQRAQVELNTQQESMTRFQNVKFGQEGEFAQQRVAMFEPIVSKTDAAIAALAKRDKFTIVLDKSAVVYVEGAQDITAKVVEYMKNGK